MHKYPYRGRIIRPHDGRVSPYGGLRTLSGHRYVETVYDELQFSRRMSDNVGERSAYGSGSIGDAQFRFQTPIYLAGVLTSDELVLLNGDGGLESYNIVTPAPHIGRSGIGGRRIGGYTVILAQRKDAQNADKDIYL